MTKLSIFSVKILMAIAILNSVDMLAAPLPDFAKLTEKVKPSVVNITAVQKQSDQQENMFDQLFRRRNPQQEEGYSPPPRSQGSGFIIESDGYILTNRHVVENAESVTVFLSDRREFEAEVVGSDEGTDVALLKIKAKGLPTVSIGNSENTRQGEWVMAIGAPFGFDHTVTSGIISAKKRQIGRGQQYVPFIQTDVAINPGNSGGPLIDMQGRVIGINSQIWTRSGGFMGISFAIPIELAIDVANQIRENGKVSRGFIGVTYQDVDFNQAKAFGLDEVYGALIPEVSEEGPADKAGLKSGDIVLSINNQKINRAADLPFTIGRTHPGDKVPFKILRDGKAINMVVVVGERPGVEEEQQSETQSLTNRLGISVTNIDERLLESINETGILVTRLERGPAALAGIRRGDIIISVNRRKVNSVKEFKEIVETLPINKGFPVLVIRPQLGKRFFVVRIPE